MSPRAALARIPHVCSEIVWLALMTPSEDQSGRGGSGVAITREQGENQTCVLTCVEMWARHDAAIKTWCHMSRYMYFKCNSTIESDAALPASGMFSASRGFPRHGGRGWSLFLLLLCIWKHLRWDGGGGYGVNNEPRVGAGFWGGVHGRCSFGGETVKDTYVEEFSRT